MVRKKKLFYGWWVAWTAALLNFFAGGTFIYGFTVFFNPIRNTFGWSSTVTSVAFSLRGLEIGLLDPIVGLLVDRVGPRKLLFAGWGMLGLGFLLMSRINSIWTFYAAFLLLTAGFSFGSFVVLNTAITHWFNKKRSRALGIIYVGMGASGILAPLLALSVDQLGWRTTLVVIGIVSLTIVMPLCTLMKDKPEQYGYLPDGETRETINETADATDLHSPNKLVEAKTRDSSATEFTATAALKTRAFWLLSAAFFFQHISIGAVNVHIVPYLESVNVPTTLAATTVTGMTLCSLIGRLGFGFLGDYTNKRYLVAIAVTIQTIGLLFFSFIDTDTAWLIIPFLLTYGPGYGGPVRLRAALLADYFGRRSFGTILGWLAFITMLGGVASPVIAGWVFDTTGNYRVAWQAITIITIPAIPLILLCKPPKAN